MELDDVAERVKVTNHAYAALLDEVDRCWRDTSWPVTQVEINWAEYCNTVDELRNEWRNTVAEVQGLEPWW
jgi:hypothetical protein